MRLSRQIRHVYEEFGDFESTHLALSRMLIARDDAPPREAARPEVVDLRSSDDDDAAECASSPRPSRRRAASPSPEASSPHPAPRVPSDDRNGLLSDDRDDAAGSGKCLNLRKRRTISRGVAPTPPKRSKRSKRLGFFGKLRLLFSNMRRMWSDLGGSDLDDG